MDHHKYGRLLSKKLCLNASEQCILITSINYSNFQNKFRITIYRQIKNIYSNSE